jgi:DNA/RNA-binding domain of Phe-tRNA-synthetase-like protein
MSGAGPEAGVVVMELSVGPLAIDEHPKLALGVLEVDYPHPVGSLASPAWLVALLAASAPDAPLESDDTIRGAIRDVLRHAGYKPTGRGKPASEYLLKAAADGALGSINVAVDLGNAVSLHSGLPISVVDLERVRPPLRVAPGAPGESYVFNGAGHAIDVEGLLCLHDADGPCANAVKDSMRTKTGAETTRTLMLVWGAAAHRERLAAALDWLRKLSERLDARVA